LECADSGGALDFCSESKAASRYACRRTPNYSFQQLLGKTSQTQLLER
jgi:hypothetical protein